LPTPDTLTKKQREELRVKGITPEEYIAYYWYTRIPDLLERFKVTWVGPKPEINVVYVKRLPQNVVARTDTEFLGGHIYKATVQIDNRFLYLSDEAQEKLLLHELAHVVAYGMGMKRHHGTFMWEMITKEVEAPKRYAIELKEPSLAYWFVVLGLLFTASVYVITAHKEVY